MRIYSLLFAVAMEEKRSRVARSFRRALAGLAALSLLAPGLAAQTVLTLDPAAGEFPVGVAVAKTGHFWVGLEPVCQVRRYTPEWKESLRVTRSGLPEQTQVIVLECKQG